MTVKLNAEPAVADAGALTVKCVAAAGLTLMLFDVPVIDDATVSVAVIVCEPAVLSVALKVPTPLLSVELTGSVAAPSVEVNYLGTVLPNASSAVTVKLKALPAVALAGALSAKCVAAPALTAMGLDVPAMPVP